MINLEKIMEINCLVKGGGGRIGNGKDSFQQKTVCTPTYK